MGLLLNGTGDLVTKYVEKAKVHNVFFTSVLTVKTDLQVSQPPEIIGKAQSKIN